MAALFTSAAKTRDLADPSDSAGAKDERVDASLLLSASRRNDRVVTRAVARVHTFIGVILSGARSAGEAKDPEVASAENAASGNFNHALNGPFREFSTH